MFYTYIVASQRNGTLWWEEHASREAAFRRERQIKEWRRVWKLQLIEAGNPTWRDLYEELIGAPLPADAPGSDGLMLTGSTR